MRGKRDECGRPKHRKQYAPTTIAGLLFMPISVFQEKTDCIRTLYLRDAFTLGAVG